MWVGMVCGGDVFVTYFMLMRLFNSIDLIGCGGDINQSDSCKQCT